MENDEVAYKKSTLETSKRAAFGPSLKSMIDYKDDVPALNSLNMQAAVNAATSNIL